MSSQLLMKNNFFFFNVLLPHITTNVVRSNPAQARYTRYNIYVIKFLSDLWFSPVSSTNKTDCHDIAEILLKVSLNTITLTLITANKKFKIYVINSVSTLAFQI